MYVVTISRQGVKVSGERFPERGGSLSKFRGVRPFVLRHLGPRHGHRLTDGWIGSLYW